MLLSGATKPPSDVFGGGGVEGPEEKGHKPMTGE